MKKERDKRTTVQRRVARGNESPSDVASLYPKGTPTDDSGLPEAGVDLDIKRVREIGAVDAKSARVMKQSRLTLARKAKGEWCKWNDDDDAVRFWEAANVWNGCMIEVTQIAPMKDESIPDMPMSMFEGDYGLFKRRIRETYWKGHAATYYWKCYDRTHPQLACGQIEFSRSDDDMNQNRQPPPGGGYPYPPQNPYGPPQNPYGGFGGGVPPNPYMPYGGMPFPQQQQYPGQVGAAFEQQQPPPQPPQQAPVAVPPVAPVMQGTDPNLVQMLMHLSAQLSHAQQQNAYLQQQILQMQAQQQTPTVHPATQTKDDEKKDASPISALKQSLDDAKNVMNLGKTFAKEFSPETEAEEPETKTPEEPFPVQIKEVGGVNLIAEHGEVVREFWPNAFVNSKGAMAMGMGFFDKIAGIVKSAAEANAAPKKEKEKEHDAALERARQMAEIEAQRAESFERAARARREMEEMNARSGNGGMQQQVVVESPPPVPPPESVPEPFPIPETSQDQPTPPPNGSAST